MDKKTFRGLLFVMLTPLLFANSCLLLQGYKPKSDQGNKSLVNLLAILGLSENRQSTSQSSPTVQRNSTYTVSKTTHSYAQGLSHSNWGTTITTVVDLGLDLYLPENAPSNRPAMILIHGGGFYSGSKEDTNIVAMANYFASRGWVCISISYRLAAARGTLSTAWGTYVLNNIAPADREQSYALYPAARDAKAALRWLHSNATTYKINSNYMTALGGSAGAFLANMLGITNPSDFRDEALISTDSTLSTTNLTASSSVHTIIDHWGGLTHMTYLTAINSQSRFDATDPPISIIHGTADVTVPFSQGEALRDAYIATGATYEFHPLVGEGHSAWSATINGKSLSENAFNFITNQQNLTILE